MRPTVFAATLLARPVKIAAFSDHEDAIWKERIEYKAEVLENLETPIEWPTALLRELAKIRISSPMRFSGNVDFLRRKTDAARKRDITKAKRAQSRFLEELRKPALVT